ncbi:Gmad2 immunoglobulin-like domain-containing protein [Bacillus sp. EAC]|uniref:Gmad2 immunoglobulin-like domain-containing protein n=1 Tax=Bacillus sp. EAC TaxID=1978338 RepID=UPI000B43DAE8|nr:Gmad2 immunoglobulin-like domain-containing protein [Bacillus sp. EAC]
MKKIMFISLAIISVLCLASCQTKDYGNKDGKTTIEDKDKTPVENKDNEPKNELTLYGNDVFKDISVVREETVNNVFQVEGKASVFEAMFLYRLEDGHNVLAEGSVMADQGAPEWGNFKFKINHKQASSPNGVLTIYVASAKDGSPEHELNIPVQFPNY